jgi:hypothetical protein
LLHRALHILHDDDVLLFDYPQYFFLHIVDFPSANWLLH